MNTPWRKVSSAEFTRSESTHVGAMAMYVSPFQVPEAYRLVKESDSSGYMIEFRYLDEGEPVRMLPEKDGIRACVGKYSSRLFQIHISEDVIASAIAETIANCGMTAAAAIGRLPAHEGRRGTSDNFRIAQGVLERSNLSVNVGDCQTGARGAPRS